MTIKEVKEKLENSTGPVARALHQGEGFKTLVLGFKEGMILKEHKASITSKLTVLEGQVLYKEKDREFELNTYDTFDIPVDVPHSVEALKDSLCLLTQGNS